MAYKETENQIRQYLHEGKTLAYTARMTGVSVPTVQRIKRTMNDYTEAKTASWMSAKQKAEWDYLHERYGKRDNVKSDHNRRLERL